jgi:threonyl-tRNA synthetase
MIRRKSASMNANSINTSKLKNWTPLLLRKLVIHKLYIEYDKVAELRNGFSRPVIIHRAILGSLERLIGILCEHTGGKWPFWLSPRQIILLPIGKQDRPFAQAIYDRLLIEGYNVSIDLSGDKL